MTNVPKNDATLDIAEHMGTFRDTARALTRLQGTLDAAKTVVQTHTHERNKRDDVEYFDKHHPARKNDHAQTFKVSVGHHTHRSPNQA